MSICAKNQPIISTKRSNMTSSSSHPSLLNLLLHHFHPPHGDVPGGWTADRCTLGMFVDVHLDKMDKN